jgi:transposase
MARKRYRSWTPDESFLFPPSPRDWLEDDHLVYFVLDLVELLDLSAIDGALQAKDPRGERPYNPAMMTALLIYGYSTGVYSSRRSV